MTSVAPRSRFFDMFALQRRSSAERQNTAARPPNLRGGRLSVVLCLGANAIGIIALIGYVLGNASITSLSANGKPVPVVTALALIVLGAGLLALRSPAPAGVLTARRAALAVIVLGAADLMSAALSHDMQEWQVWAARGGVNVHAYPFAAFLFIALGSALTFITTRRDFAGHVIASAVLLICAVFSFAYALSVPSFLDPSTRVLPVAVTTLGLALISAAELLARPRGWVTPLLARTPAGLMSRLLLAAATIVPFLALALRALMIDAHWYNPEVGLTVIVVVNVLFGAAIALGAGVILLERESDQEALRRSEELLRVAQRAGRIGHFCWDIQNNINTWSDELVALYGLPPGSFDGQYESWRKRIFPDDLAAADAQIRNSLTSGEFSCDFRVVWPDASIHWMHASAKVLFSDDGKPLRMVGVNMDITERKQAEEAVQLARERLQTLSRRLLEIQEAERRKAARELHDEIGQALTAIKITLQSLQRYPEPAAMADRLGESVGIVERALEQVRSLSLELRPPLLDDLGLGPALRWLVDQHTGRAGLGVDFRNSVVDARFDTEVETACFRVAQEALNNVVRHAGARHVTVELHLENDGLHLRVSDDGAGFDVPAAHRRAAQGTSLGLLGMEERAALAGGGIEWRSAPGEGAEVHAWFPLPRPAGMDDETAATA